MKSRKLKSLSYCRLCENQIKKIPILKLNHMPIAAQHFLTKKEINKKDKFLNLQILQCAKCSLVQLDIKPVNYYKSVITATSISGSTKTQRLEQMKNFCRKFKLKSKKVIELGCGSGAMLDIINATGMKAYGLEYSKQSVAIGKNNKRNIIQGYLNDLNELKSSPYDAFICYNFIEHIPNINLFLNKIRENLKDNGVGIVTVPNLDYLIKTKSLYEFVADHLSYFTKNTICYLFEKHNFKILECKFINNKNDIFIMVKKIDYKLKIKKFKPKILNLKNDYAEVEKLIKHLKNISSDYKKKNKKIAIWGAGHRTLALLVLAQLKNIFFIVDSAKFKQNKFSPINFTKIVSPQNLDNRNIDLLIVMLPGIYPDEVINKLLRQKVSYKLAKLINNKIKFIN